MPRHKKRPKSKGLEKPGRAVAPKALLPERTSHIINRYSSRFRDREVFSDGSEAVRAGKKPTINLSSIKVNHELAAEYLPGYREALEEEFVRGDEDPVRHHNKDIRITELLSRRALRDVRAGRLGLARKSFQKGPGRERIIWHEAHKTKLPDYLKGATLAEKRVWFDSLVRSIAIMHSTGGVVHGDLGRDAGKNIWMDKDRVPRISDFGMARDISPRGRLAKGASYQMMSELDGVISVFKDLPREQLAEGVKTYQKLVRQRLGERTPKGVMNPRRLPRLKYLMNLSKLV
jgi:hypothetical protein